VAVVSGASLVAALALRQSSTVAVFAPRRHSKVGAFEQHQLSGGHTLPAETLADQAPHLDSIMAVLACLLYGQMDSLAQLIGQQAHRLAESLPQIVSQVVLAQMPLWHADNQIA
jgi:hypothetical protein